MDRETENNLIKNAEHDPRAFGELFEEYHEGILRYCIYHTSQVEIARDITAETFFKALKNLWRYRFTGAPFSAWLYRIAKNEVIDYFRRKKYAPQSLSEAMEREELIAFESRRNLQEEIDAAQKKLEENEAYMKLRSAMEEMPMHYRDVLVLRFVQEKKISEICEILGKKEGTVKSLISRGLVVLREISGKNLQPRISSAVCTDGVLLKESLADGK